MAQIDDLKILYQFPFCNVYPERLDNLKIQAVYAQRCLLGKSECVVIESTTTGNPTLSEQGLSGFKVVQYKEPKFSIQRSRNEIIKYGFQNKFDFIVMIDADFLIERKSVKDCIEWMFIKDAAMAYPYSGHFYNIERSKVQQYPDYDKISSQGLIDKNSKGEAPGGCSILNLRKITPVDLYHEGFVGYGCEDTHYVAHILTKYGKLGRINKAYFHLDHKRIGVFYDGKDMRDNIKKYHELTKPMNVTKDIFFKIEM